jgi:hypothetical protein
MSKRKIDIGIGTVTIEDKISAGREDSEPVLIIGNNPIINELNAQLSVAQRRIVFLESLLKEIEEHPHCREDQVHWPDPPLDPYDDSQWCMGYAQGHRCAAKIARKWREK